jgi:parallel beta-helix repeat protein
VFGKMRGLLRRVLTIGFAVIFLVAIGLAFFEWNMFAYAAGAIYIRADGTVEGTTFIQSSDNVTYVFTADIIDCDYVYVERSNIIVDGNGHVLNGSSIAEDGISVMFVNNVTIKNVSIHNFVCGIYLYDAVNNTISDNTVTNNEFGIVLNSCWNNTVSGNTVTGSNSHGIYLYSSPILSSNYNSISGNNITENGVHGVYVESSNNNTILGNNITENKQFGIQLSSSSNNSIFMNYVEANSFHGIYLDSSQNNSIYGNNVTNNEFGITIIWSSDHNSVSDNNVQANSNCGIYVHYSSNNIIFGNNATKNQAGANVLLYYSTNNKVFDNDLANSTNGVFLSGGSDNSIFENRILNCYESGVWLHSDFNSIIGNNVTYCYNGIGVGYYHNNTICKNNLINNNNGVYLHVSSDNHLFHNNFINNSVQAYVQGTNSWNDSYPSGGNYWSGYTDVDSSSGPYQNITGVPDGIWDHPYIINENNTDHYPLKFPYETQPPAITILSPENKTYAVNSGIQLNFTIDEFASWIGYSLNGQPNATITGNTTLPLLLDGWHYVIVYANDTFGNMGMNIVYFAVDTAEPNITNVSQDPLDDIMPDTVVRINATITDATSGIKQVLLNCTFTNSTSTWYTVLSMAHLTGDIWNATIPPYPYGTNVTYVIIAEDNAGNTITTEQIYGYKYEYQVVPELELSAILVAFMTVTTLLTAIVYRKKRQFLRETK